MTVLGRVGVILVVVLTAAPVWAQTTLFSTDFESGATLTSLFCANGQPCNVNTTNAANVISTVNSHSPTHSVFYSPLGHDTSGGLTTNIAATDRFYLSFWWFLSPTFTNQTAGGQHAFRFWVPPSPGTFGAILQLDTVFQQGGGPGPNFSIDILGTAGAEAGLDSLSTYHNITTLPRGQWFRFEMLAVMNNPGSSANGTLKIWINGVPVKDVSTVQWRLSTSSLWSTFLLNSNYDSATSNEFWYQDDVQLTTTCPTTGAACSTQTTSTPGTPANVTVTTP